MHTAICWVFICNTCSPYPQFPSTSFVWTSFLLIPLSPLYNLISPFSLFLRAPLPIYYITPPSTVVILRGLKQTKYCLRGKTLPGVFFVLSARERRVHVRDPISTGHIITLLLDVLGRTVSLWFLQCFVLNLLPRSFFRILRVLCLWVPKGMFTSFYMQVHVFVNLNGWIYIFMCLREAAFFYQPISMSNVSSIKS